MNSFEVNKIFGAILGTLVFVMGVGFIADEIYAPIEGRGAGYALPEPVEDGAAGGAEEVPGVAPIAARMQTASASAGQGLIARCQACHDYSPENANRTGPGIYGVVGHPIASHDGFAYSDVLAEMGAEGEVWDYEHLDAFLESPRNFAPGTKMSFAGLSNPEDRANLIAFLRENSDDPYPLPEAPAEEPAAEGAGDEAAAPAQDELSTLLASVTPEQGQALIVRCQACHDYSAANANRVGPGIYDIVGQEIAHHAEFAYSDALAAMGVDGETWTPANLDAFFESPSTFAPGTKMSFPGLSSPEDRAALIVYLNTLSDDPTPLVEAPAEEPAAEEPAAEEAAEAAEAAVPAEEAAAPADDELVMLLASVTPEQGQALIVRCQACHDYTAANANRVGPGIYDIVGQEIAHHAEFAYSDALAAMGEAGETWTPANLDAFFESPRDFAPGTKMSFPGLSSPEDRAALIVFLNTLSDDPMDLTGGGGAPAEPDQPVADEVDALTLEGEDAPAAPAQ
ncbi:c-type cytochrome [Pelagibacterium lacus]|uniref:Cytochrome c domain-containing protein n=1 Tax=Pelagibacterium lacus TaxID=2282655 RepID=A0A369W5T0_9HYPH|nr:hypothetical protein [Pelagibacterium lacus]RDE10024.1 hypothetical protein DVH29_03580 [Pelagibacterium lacus]